MDTKKFKYDCTTVSIYLPGNDDHPMGEIQRYQVVFTLQKDDTRKIDEKLSTATSIAPFGNEVVIMNGKIESYRFVGMPYVIHNVYTNEKAIVELHNA